MTQPTSTHGSVMHRCYGVLRALKRRFTTLASRAVHYGRAHYCPLCRSRLRAFLPHGIIPRPGARCPVCGALERHRLAWLYLQQHTNGSGRNPKRFLHVAPEPTLASLLRAKGNLRYVSADIKAPDADVHTDLEETAFVGGSFDIIYCSHVLEHVADDRRALQELRRIVKPDGLLILQIPISSGVTFEDPSVTDGGERSRLFGQPDHVRRYGRDVLVRLRDAGFTFEEWPAAAGAVVTNDLRMMGIPDGESLFLCRVAAVSPTAHNSEEDSRPIIEGATPPTASDGRSQPHPADRPIDPGTEVRRGATDSIIIERKPGWRPIDLRELWEYRDLFYFLVSRDIKARYAQSILGLGWAVLRPLVSMVIFTLVFGRALKISSDGVPYPVFNYVGVVAWIYFSSALSTSTSSLIVHRNMITKVYFPRLVVPLSSVLGQLIDFLIALMLLFVLMASYGISPTPWAVTVPFLVAVMVLTVAGAGMWLTALAVQYRDISYGMGFGIQLLMFLSPVVYPVSAIPEQLRVVYAINPMVGVIEGLRAALLGTKPMPWDLIGVGVLISIVLALTGAFYFRRMERTFADVA